MPLYLLHFDRPLAHAQHYLGWSGGDPIQRVQLHRTGHSGCRITEAAVANGIQLDIGWFLYVGSRADERRLKVRSRLRILCRICVGHAAASARWRKIERAITEGRHV